MLERLTSNLLIISSFLLIILSVTLTACGPVVVVYASTPTEPVAIKSDEGDPTAWQPTTNQWQPTVNLDEVMSSPDYGMHVFLYWREEVANRDVTVVDEAGFRWIKQQFPWREIEGEAKGSWKWEIPDRMMTQIEAHDLKVIARLDAQPQWAAPLVKLPAVSPPDNLSDFYDYVYAVASRYKGRIHAYQIWNEPNLAREWGGRSPNPAEYVAMLKVGYQAVKDADPDAVVISAGLAPTTRHDDQAMPDLYFIQGMYDAGAAPYFDALGVHAAGFKSPPDIDPAIVAKDRLLTNGDSAPEELRRIYCFRHVEDVRALMVKNGDVAKKIVILEFGWTVEPRPNSPYRWHAVSQAEQARYFTGAYQYATDNWRPWIGVMSLIYVANPDWHMNMEETYWSIVYPYYPELRVAPAYEKLKLMEKVSE